MYCLAVDADSNTRAMIVTDPEVYLYDLGAETLYTISVCAETSVGFGDKIVIEEMTSLPGRKF
jgi:hypothetical protein